MVWRLTWKKQERTSWVMEVFYTFIVMVIIGVQKITKIIELSTQNLGILLVANYTLIKIKLK
jgi:hypothetical protein